MTAPVQLRRTKADWPRPGEWKLLIQSDGRKSASVCCPECRQIATLHGHKISETGQLDASLDCPVESCGWHVKAVLVGWAAL